MIRTIAIRSVQKDPFVITWNVGRRCNYDCSYCEDTHHNNYSRHKTLDEFKATFDFIDKWTCDKDHKHIWFTGGEPTMNPNFWQLLDYIPDNYFIGVTTNGAWGPVNTKRLIDNANSVTISYHAEGDPNLKELVLENILTINDSSLGMQVNLMMHTEHWDECVSVYEKLKAHKVNVLPRLIGDGNILRKGWFIDKDGNNRRTSQEYNTEQQAWFYETKGIKVAPSKVLEGTQIGRSCCGGRCLEGKIEGEWQSITAVNTEFKDWYCSVNQYFLHIDQETNLVYHHQTCQVLHDKKRGAIGSLDNVEEMLAYKELNKDNIIVCPVDRCGCGMCVPKAKSLDDYEVIRKHSN